MSSMMTQYCLDGASHPVAKKTARRQGRTVKGIQAVVDQIEVRRAQRTDLDIAKDVIRVLLINTAIDSDDLHVSVVNAIVTLSGTTDSWAEKRLAEIVAKGVRGVKDITNDIYVKVPEIARSDGQIEAEIVRRFKNDIWLAGTRLKAKVEKGVVTLSGSVGRALQRSRAAVRAHIMGVQLVRNDVTMDRRLRRNLQRTDDPNKTDEEIKRLLTGLVDKLKANRAAEQDAKYTIGVKRVKSIYQG